MGIGARSDGEDSWGRGCKSGSIIELHLSIEDHRDGFPSASMVTSHHPIRVLEQSLGSSELRLVGGFGRMLGVGTGLALRAVLRQ